MSKKIDRNDPCPCGSGKKFKKCNVNKKGPLSTRRIKAKVLTANNVASQISALKMINAAPNEESMKKVQRVIKPSQGV